MKVLEFQGLEYPRNIPYLADFGGGGGVRGLSGYQIVREKN